MTPCPTCKPWRPAMDFMESSGALTRQARDVLYAVLRYPGRSSKELALTAGLERHAAGSRCPELQAAGWIRREASRNGGDLLCWPTQKALVWRRAQVRGEEVIDLAGYGA